jgi:glycosyltransferase involved in cell wall biosynthesis
MKILYFTRDYTSHDYRFLDRLAKSGHAIYYLRLERRGHVLEDRPLPPEVEIVHWMGGQSPARLSNGPRLLLGLRRVIRNLQPDILHAGPLQRSAFLAALTGFQPLVSMSWGYDLLQDAQRNAAWRWATRYTLQHSAALVGDCETIRQLAISYGMPADRIVTFPWGVDLEHFSPGDRWTRPNQPQPEAIEKPFTLLSTRNWEPIYGVETIARAFVQAARQQPELQLVMLGNGSQAGLLRQVLSREGLLDGPGAGNYPRVLLPGQVTYADLPRFYRLADLYVAATHSDGTSISLLEAMACGCPALVSDIPGNREWIAPGENGWLTPVGNVDALAQAMLRAVETRRNLPEMGRAARALAEQRADWNANFPRLFEAYRLARTIGMKHRR